MRFALIVMTSVAVSLFAQQASIAPDRQALEDAQKLKDPRLEIDALNKLVADFPTSRYARRAKTLILETLLKRFPARTEAIADQIDVVLAANADDRADISSYVARQLLDAGVLLERAQSLAAQAVLDGTTADARVRATYLATLGNAYVRRDRIPDAERSFRDAYQLRPTLTPAAEGLAETALRQKRDGEAYDYLVRARVTGLLTPAHQQALETFYSTEHHGSLEGLDAMLDKAHRTLFPPAVLDVRPYVASAARTNRIALAELFTGSGCPPCAGADAAMDAVMARYRPTEVIAILHHLHIPRPDPMTNSDTVGHAIVYNALGTPALFLDGVSQRGFAGDREDAPGLYAKFVPAIDKELDQPAEATVSVSATLANGIVTVHGAVTDVKSDAKMLAVRVALLENLVRYGGENGVRFHPMVVRALASGSATTIDRSFDLATISADLKRYLDDFEQHNEEFGSFTFAEKKFTIDPNNLTVVAFLQDTTKRHVLQSAATKVQSAQSKAAREEAPNPIHWSLAGAPARPLAAGETVTVRLMSDIDKGWHLYGLDLPANGPMSTDISLPAGQPFALAGPIDAPKGREIFDPNFGVRLELYTEKTTFGLPIRVTAGAAPGEHPLSVQVRYQSCSDTLCLPPRTVKVELKLEVR